MKILLLSLLVMLSSIQISESYFYEMRCKCVCPKNEAYEEFTANQTVFIKAIGGPTECNCRYVVGSERNDSEYVDLVLEVCNKCQCSYEQRLHFMNQGVISLTLIFLFAMSVYTVVIVIVNLVRSRRKSSTWTQIQPDQDEEFRSNSYKTVIRNRLKRWQDQVAKQRSVVYGIPVPNKN
ncbi:hypothetical protein LOD99_15796 [Oopsacas minuta]|uniref:Transmembrane protein 9 n=1 Tax=Oopsacas minuta TaxID=111878 RepID=A0AAV7KA39_9METZ|nr:hypothetical protein LOD99_15796 [Oopsacas minuta]